MIKTKRSEKAQKRLAFDHSKRRIRRLEELVWTLFTNLLNAYQKPIRSLDELRRGMTLKQLEQCTIELSLARIQEASYKVSRTFNIHRGATIVAWYSDWFGEEYLRLYAHRDDTEAARHTEFVKNAAALKQGDRVLDVACGNGRHVASFHRAGHRSVGVDLSQTLVRIGHKRLAEYQNNAQVLRADMRVLPFPTETFQLLVSMFTSFGYFETDGEHLALLTEWRRVLSHKGHLFIDYLNRDYTIANLVPRTEETSEEREVIQERSISSDGRRIVKHITINFINDDRRLQFTESVRMYNQSEIETLLKQSGFRLMSTFGDFDGSTFTESSERLLILADAM